MKKINNRFSLSALSDKVELSKYEMQVIKGGIYCYCANGCVYEVTSFDACRTSC
ncbi:MAG: TIGR04149 family rSAM-modified RiPP [Janthinobacterium lividum]